MKAAAPVSAHAQPALDSRPSRNVAIARVGPGPQRTAAHDVALGNSTVDLSDTSGRQSTWSESRFGDAHAVCIE